MTTLRTHLISVLLVPLALLIPFSRSTAGPDRIPDGYSVETIEIPDRITLEVGGLAFAPNGDLYVATRYGNVWIYRDGNWKRFADGLQTALGISIAEGGDRIYVVQKPELTELVDTDGDDRAEEYNTVSDEWGYTGEYHEFAFGPVRDSLGNFYVALNLAHQAPGVVPGTMSRSTRDRGTLVKITPEGKLSTAAYGLRSPASMAMSPDRELFLIDSQGDWVATSALFEIHPGKFYGHPGSLAQHPRYRNRNVQDVDPAEFEKLRTRPAVWFPYSLANSPGSPAFDTNEIDFGPFDGQMFVGDQTKSNLMRVDLEKIHGAYQGVVLNFIDHLKCGITRSVFGPDGGLWVGQTDRGWNSVGSKRYGLQRITYDGETVPHAIRTIRLAEKGFTIHFTRPINRSVARKKTAYDVRHWHYKYHHKYGSPPTEVKEGTIQSITVVNDRTVRLTLDELPEKKVYEIRAGVPSKKGKKPATETGFYTLNRRR